MANKTVDKPKVTNSLRKFKLQAEEDPYPKRYVSKTAGTKKRKTFGPKRRMDSIRKAVSGFFRDVVAAVKSLIREAM
jgi:hypothetical protein